MLFPTNRRLGMTLYVVEEALSHVKSTKPTNTAVQSSQTLVGRRWHSLLTLTHETSGRDVSNWPIIEVNIS